MNERISRRSFLTLNLEASVGFLGNIFLPQIEQERNFFRPPGSGSELEFLTSCSRCTKCAEACPPSIIKLFALDDGAKLVNTPYIDPNELPCTFCDACIESCPTGALSLFNKAEHAAIGKAEVTKQACLAYKEVMCDYCVRSCPVKGALSLLHGKPKVDATLCTGCGFCVSSCVSESGEKGIRISLLETF